MNFAPQGSGFSPAACRDVTAELTFVRGGGRTVLAHQRVPYPFHITRPFGLDRDLLDLATVYLQSASGGLYRGDRLRLELRANAGAMVHLTSQAATVVHRTPGAPAQVSSAITIGDGAFLALTNDPFILFPEATFISAMEVTMSGTARAIISDGYATHDPEGLSRPFEQLDTGVRIASEGGRLIATDRGRIGGTAFMGAGSPLGRYRAMGNMLVLGPRRHDIDPHDLAAALDALGCCAGLSELPNGGGLIIRCLAPTGGQLARGMDRLFALAFNALLGKAPARRRK